MSNIDKLALRQLATDAHELGIIKRYTKGIEANKRFIAAATPLTVLALLDDLEAAEHTAAVNHEAACSLVEENEEVKRKLTASEKRIAELEAMREVFLRAKALMYQSGGAPIEHSLNPIDAWLYDAERATAGIGIHSLHPNTVPPAPVVPDEIRNKLKAEGLSDLLRDARDYAPLTSEQWETLTNNWHQTFVGLSGENDSCRAAMLQGSQTVSNRDELSSPVIPDGYVLVPIVPTEDMVIDGFESEPDPDFSDEKEWEEYEALSGCQQAAHRAKLCWAAMIAAAQREVRSE